MFADAGADLQRTFTQQCKQENAKTGFQLLTAFVTVLQLSTLVLEQMHTNG